MFIPQEQPKRAMKFSLPVDSDRTPLATTLSFTNKHNTSLLNSTLAQNVINAKFHTNTKLLGDQGNIRGKQELAAVIHGCQPIFNSRKYQKYQLKPS